MINWTDTTCRGGRGCDV